MSGELLEELERLSAAATPGSWRAGRADMTSYHGDGRGPYKAIYVDDPNGELHHMGGRLPSVVAEAFAGLEGEERCIENAQLIAAMRNALPELIRLARLGLEAERRTTDLTGEAMRDCIEYLHKNDGFRSLRVRVFDGDVKLTIENGSAEPVAESKGALFHEAVATLKDEW